jgi:hypothetical protein
LVFAGSFTTIRRRRLASPTSILEIEATHPLVNPAAIDFSDVKLTGRERKAAVKDRGVRRERADDRER